MPLARRLDIGTYKPKYPTVSTALLFLTPEEGGRWEVMKTGKTPG